MRIARHSVFFSVVTINMFSFVNKMMLISLGEYFSAVVSNGRVLRGSSLQSALGHGDFEHKDFTK